jgi:aspartate aminotransferase
VHLSDPTWGNHAPLLGSSGLQLGCYPYYDAAAHGVRFEAMLQQLERAAAGDVVLIHVCCHNPTGADLTPAQWDTLAELLQRRDLLPFLDLAYQGFGTSLDDDAAAVRMIAQRLPEALVAISYSKNLGLYRERVGALISISENAERADAVQSHVLQIARSIYSMPPDHGAAIAAKIFADSNLRRDWLVELDAMRSRFQEMRALLASNLRDTTAGGDFDFIASQRGMFSLLGVSPSSVERLREKHHIYMTDDSRMNLAGIMPHNVRYVAEAIAAERGT